MKLLTWAGVWTCFFFPPFQVWFFSPMSGIVVLFIKDFWLQIQVFEDDMGFVWGFTVSNHLKCIFVWDFTRYLWRIFLVLRTIKQLHGSPAFWCVIAWWFSVSSRCDVPKTSGMFQSNVGWSCVHHKVNMWCTITLYLCVWYIRLWYVICVSYWFWHMLFTYGTDR